MFIPARIKRLRGFTLIELLIVIAIMGILAAAVLVAINPAKRQNQARDAQVKGDIGSIATALQAYFTTPGQGSYPDGLDDLVTNQDLTAIPTPPGGGAYTGSNYVVAPVGCTGLAGSLCTSAKLMFTLFDPAATGNVWCWQSTTGKAQELAVAACTP